MYFDLHTHPSFKSYLSHPEPDQKDDCWKTYNSIIGIIESQSSLEQLKNGNVNLAVVPIYSMERPFTSSFLLEHIAPKLPPLHQQMMHFPTQSDSFDRLMEEIHHFERSGNIDPSNGKTFKILSNIEEFDPNQLNVILAIEGSHGLDKFNTELLDNLKEIKNGPYRFLYLTLTHLTQFPVCTHAYGMKLIKKNDEFKPDGHGLTDLGKQLIDLAYDESDGNRILIDIKHMSLVSRRQFYQYRKEKGYDDIPIVASHMGCTGISSQPQEVSKYFKKKVARDRGFILVNYDRPRGIGRGGWFFKKKKTYFNPWSINLFDEEIPIILDSGGLIGVSLDQRILGSQKVKGEYFSEAEFFEIMGARDDDALKNFDVTSEFEEDPEHEGQERKRRVNQRNHLRHLCNNILHIVRTAGREEAWKQICIGSDFDGLINPVNNCISSEEFPYLENDLIEMLEEMIGEAKKEDSSAEFFESDMRRHVRDIMYDNAVEFLQKNFKAKKEIA